MIPRMNSRGPIEANGGALVLASPTDEIPRINIRGPIEASTTRVGVATAAGTSAAQQPRPH